MQSFETSLRVVLQQFLDPNFSAATYAPHAPLDGRRMIASEMDQHHGLLEDVHTSTKLPFDEPRPICLEDAIMFSPPFRPQLRQSTTHGIRRLRRDIHAILLLLPGVGAPAQEVARRPFSHRHPDSVT